MSLSVDQTRKIAHLARLAVPEDELSHYSHDLSRIMGLIDQMQAVDTKGIEPLANALDATARLREDAVTETDQREAMQALAPAVQDGLYLVPRVID